MEPDKDAKLLLIFCEGSNTEPDYFKYFNEINSRIRIVAVPAIAQGENNSPTGLFEKACKALLKTDDNPNPEYDLQKEDEVWFAVDTDQWDEKLPELRNSAVKHGWKVAQSNPCFEVWLYYHFHDALPDFEGHESSTNWKEQLNKFIAGGFDNRKYPVYIQTAIDNSLKNFNSIEIPSSTEIHLLAERFIPMIINEISEALDLLKKK